MHIIILNSALFGKLFTYKIDMFRVRICFDQILSTKKHVEFPEKVSQKTIAFILEVRYYHLALLSAVP